MLKLYRLYKEHIQNKFYILLSLQLISAVFEGFGIALILPLLSEFDPSFSGSSESRTVVNILEKLHLPTEGLVLALIIIGAFYTKALVMFINGWYQGKLNGDLEYKIRKSLIQEMLDISYPKFSEENSGHYINLVVGQVKRAVVSFNLAVNIVSGILYCLIFMVLSFWLQWEFSAIVILLGSGSVFVFRYIGQKVKEISRKEIKAMNKLSQITLQFFTGFKYLKATKKNTVVGDHILEKMEELRLYYYKTRLANAFSSSITEPILLTILLISLYLSTTYGGAEVSTLLIAIVLIYRALTRLTKVQSNWQSMMSNVGSIQMIIDETVRFANSREPNGDQPVKASDVLLEFKNVDFGFGDSDDLILNQVNFQLKKNQTLAIVGESGSGKSTLLDLITGLQKRNRGDILINGISIDSIDLGVWRKRIGYVTQDVLMFDDSIRNNITLWDKDNTELALERSMQMANAFDFVMEKEMGVETMVGDRGLRLSGGQKQRISIARELYKSPELLILDEATSALDTESEKSIKDSIDGLKGSLSLIIVAHRLSTIENADYILVMDKGKIVESGTFSDLLDKKARFHRMVTLQSTGKF